MPAVQEDMRKAMEDAAVQLMQAGTSKKDAMKLSGCNYTPGDKNYRRVCKRFYRLEGKKKQAKKKAEMNELRKELKVSKRKMENVQKYRREANSAYAELNASEFKRKEMCKELAKLAKR